MMPRRTLFSPFFALVLATPALAQRNRDRDQDRGPGSRPAGNRDRRPDAEPGAWRHGAAQDLFGPGQHHRTGGNQVVIKAVRRATRERLDDIKLEITQSGNVIDIDANHRVVERRNDNVVETDFDIQVPSQVKLDLRTFSAPVTVTGVAGDLTVDGFSSEMRLTDVSGPMRDEDFQRWRHGAGAAVGPTATI